MLNKLARSFGFCALGFAILLSAACQSSYPPAPEITGKVEAPDYVIGPLDSLDVFVWRSPELSQSVTVRPDGRISTPLIDDLAAAGKTPTQLARDIEAQLQTFVQDPVVTVIVGGFVGPFDQQVRVVGEAFEPRAVPYRSQMTMLDVMISVGGLTEFAAGNNAVLVRRADGEEKSYNLRLDDLLRDGDISANRQVLPGDVIIIPESFF